MILRNVFNRSDVGLVIDWSFHRKNKWVTAYTPFLVDAIVREFNPIIVTSQAEYERHKNKLKNIISMEPGWAAPKIEYDKSQGHKVFVLVSDPHNKTMWFQDYVEKNGICYVLSLYKSPFYRHFPSFPSEKFIHFPWAIPDEFACGQTMQQATGEIAIFGGQNSDAYDVRNWCRTQKHVKNFTFSGVENRQLVKSAYYLWLRQFAAIVAAGSSDQKYDLLTPKYFEIMSSGALLFGQRCADMDDVGMDESNCVIFEKEDFNEKVAAYVSEPEAYLARREKGLELIRTRHLLSHRISLLKRLIDENKV